MVPPFALSGVSTMREMKATGTISQKTSGEIRRAAAGMLQAAEDTGAKVAATLLNLFADENTARDAMERAAQPTPRV
jgi:hypothetical protein